MPAKQYRRRVDSTRNSRCATAAFRDLDFSEWFTYNSTGELMVSGPYDTWHRVTCRHDSAPEITKIDGTLYWLINKRA